MSGEWRHAADAAEFGGPIRRACSAGGEARVRARLPTMRTTKRMRASPCAQKCMSNAYIRRCAYLLFLSASYFHSSPCNLAFLVWPIPTPTATVGCSREHPAREARRPSSGPYKKKGRALVPKWRHFERQAGENHHGACGIFQVCA